MGLAPWEADLRGFRLHTALLGVFPPLKSFDSEGI